jgi:hypothetical protein
MTDDGRQMAESEIGKRAPLFPISVACRLMSVVRSQCDNSTGAVIERRIECVTPPSMNSRSREWP